MFEFRLSYQRWVRSFHWSPQCSFFIWFFCRCFGSLRDEYTESFLLGCLSKHVNVYVCSHYGRSKNSWADFTARWGSRHTFRKLDSIYFLAFSSSSHFCWPTMTDLVSIQLSSVSTLPDNVELENGPWQNASGDVWASDMMLSYSFGSVSSPIPALALKEDPCLRSRRFNEAFSRRLWRWILMSLSAIASFFLSRSCHEKVPRPSVPAIHGISLNILQQVDYVDSGPSLPGKSKVSLVSNDHSSYFWFIVCAVTPKECPSKGGSYWCAASGVA